MDERIKRLIDERIDSIPKIEVFREMKTGDKFNFFGDPRIEPLKKKSMVLIFLKDNPPHGIAEIVSVLGNNAYIAVTI